MNPTTQNNETSVEEREAKVRALLASAYPNAAPSPALRARVADHAQQYAATTKKTAPASRWFSFLAPRGVGLSAVAVAGVALLVTTTALYPRWSAAKSLQKIEAAMMDVTNVHATYFEVGQADIPDRNVEIWQDGDNLRTEERRPSATEQGTLLKSLIVTGGKSYQFDPEQNRVTVRNHEERFKSSGFTIAAMRSDYLRWGWKDTIRDLGMTMWEGRVARQISIEHDEPAGPIQFLLLVDPATDLPFRYELKLKLRGSETWETRVTGESEYNAPLPADFFTPRFPGAQVIDLDAETERLRAHLARGIAEDTIGDRRIVIRDVQANRDGTIFILYTAGKRLDDDFMGGDRFAGRDWKTTLTDSEGNTYRPYNDNALLFHRDGKDATRGLFYNGQRLEADVWVPKNPQTTPYAARSLTFTVRANPVNLHGSDWKKVTYSETATFTLPVTQASDTLTPDFAELISSDLNEKAVAKFQTDARGELPPGVRPSPELMGEFTGCNDNVPSFAFSPDGKTLAATAGPNGIRVWDVATQSVLRSLPMEKPAENIAFSPDGSRLALYSNIYDEGKRRYSHGELKLLDLTADRKLWSVNMEIKNQSLGTPAFSPDGRTITATGFRADKLEKGADGEEYIAHMMGRVKRWDAHTGADKGGVIVPEGNFHPTLTPTQDKFITLQEILEKKMMNGQAVNTSKGTRATVWDARTGALVRSLSVPGEMSLQTAAFSSDGSLIAAGGNEQKNGRILGGVVLVWNANTGELIQTLRDKASFIQGVAISPDNALILAAGGENQKSIDVWNLRTGTPGATLIGHGASVQNVAFSPDGSRFVSSDSAGRILLWKTPTAP